MELKDFEIGKRFWTKEAECLCLDIGTSCIVMLRIPDAGELTETLWSTIPADEELVTLAPAMMPDRIAAVWRSSFYRCSTEDEWRLKRPGAKPANDLHFVGGWV